MRRRKNITEFPELFSVRRRELRPWQATRIKDSLLLNREQRNPGPISWRVTAHARPGPSHPPLATPDTADQRRITGVTRAPTTGSRGRVGSGRTLATAQLPSSGLKLPRWPQKCGDSPGHGAAPATAPHWPALYLLPPNISSRLLSALSSESSTHQHEMRPFTCFTAHH